MKRIFLFSVLLLTVTAVFCGGGKKEITATVLFDNYLYKEGLKTDWGFACLIEGMEKTILLDTGWHGDTLLYNIDELNVDAQSVDIIVLSHYHNDHVGGLMTFLDRNSNVSVYMAVSFPDSFKKQVEETGAEVIPVDKPVEICKGVYSTGEMGDKIKEQGIILDTPEGAVVITGCAHPGISGMVKRSKEVIKKNIYLVFGGFHLSQHPEEAVAEIIGDFKNMGVENAGPTHCTGRRAIEMFKESYGDNFIKIGAGRVLTF